MGWWSATIMGGDEPWDQEANVLDLIGLPVDDDDQPHWEDTPERTRLALEAVPMDAWQAFFEKKDALGKHVAHQVVVVMHMAVGARLPEFLAQAAIQCSQEEDTQTWRDPGKRRFYLDKFIEQIRRYDGTPTQIEQEGLLEVICSRVAPKPH